MSARTLFQMTAGALVVGAATTLVGFAVHPEVDAASVTTGLWRVSHLLLWVGALALIVGLVGFYLRQRTEVGRLGAVGAGLAVLGLAARSGALYVETVVAPELASGAPALFEGFPSDAPWSTFRVVSGVSFVMVWVGVVVLCVGALRAALAPRWATVVVALSAALSAAGVAAGPQGSRPARRGRGRPAGGSSSRHRRARCRSDRLGRLAMDERRRAPFDARPHRLRDRLRL